MRHLSDTAATTYFFLSRESFDYGLINLFEFHSRMAYLRQMLPPDSWMSNMISDLGDEIPPEWLDDDFEIEDKITPSSLVSGEGTSSSTYSATPDDSSLLRLLTKAKGVLGEKWLFNAYDNDYFPTIPHGHLNGELKIKLDAYRGYTYDTGANNKPLSREKRAFIVDLWNDERFRILAIKAIDHYVECYPYFRWHVKHPRRLPRKRRI